MRAQVLRIKDFRTLILTRFFITIALQMQAVIVGWQVYNIRPEALLLGLLGLVEAVPAIGCSFFSGHVVDSNRPAKVYLICLLTLLLNGCGLWLVTSKWLDLPGSLQILLIFAVVFISGLVRSFAAPASFSLTPRIVPRELYSASSAWSSFAFQIAAISGPAVGGLIYGWLGATVAFAMVPGFTLVSVLGVLNLSREAKAIQSNSLGESFTKSIRSGLQFVLKEKVLLSAMTLDMFSVLFGGAVAVLPIYADQVLHVGASGLGLLRAAPAAGSMVTALTLAFSPLRAASGKTLLIAVSGFGISIICFGVSTSFVFSLICLMASGAFDGVSMIIRSTIMQLLTPDQMRGRVAAVSTVFITSSNEIGAFESGFVASLMGLVPSVVFGGVMTLAVVVLTVWGFPQLQRMRLEH